MEILDKDNFKKRGIYLLPNLFTLGSLFAGFYAIVAAFKGNFENAAISIFIAMILDGLDGRIARLTNTVTQFGAEFDSLSDMVAFGVAPGFLAYCWSLTNLGKLGWLATFIYVAAGALRLARFNTQIGKDSNKRYSQGLTITASAGVIAGAVWTGQELPILHINLVSIFFAILTVLIGVLMVSNIRFRSFKDFDLKNNVPFVVILVICLIIVLISIEPAFVLFIMFLAYALSGPIGTIWGIHQKRRFRKKTIKIKK